MPDSYFKLIWDSVMLVMMAITLFYIPLNLSFSLHIEESVMMDIFFNKLLGVVTIILN